MDIVKTKFYKVETEKAVYEWHNTNILLQNEKYHGIKTGFTPNAGACLAVLYDLMNKQ